MYIAVDIGGTKTLIAAFDDGGAIIEQAKFPTPKGYEDFKSALSQNAATLQTKQFIGGAVGIRGNINREAGLSLLDDVLDWGTAPVRDDCAAVFGCNFVLENDSKTAGYGEALLAGPDFNKVLYFTISTGIGSAFVVDGKLDQDVIDSEIGKTLYEHDGIIQQWEDFASGKAIVAKYGQRASEITDPQIWEEVSRGLALGIVNASAVYTPNLIILGGGVGAHYDKFQAPLLKTIDELKPAELTVPEIRGAVHAEEAVIYGCYQLARQAYGKLS